MLSKAESGAPLRALAAGRLAAACRRCVVGRLDGLLSNAHMRSCA